MLTPSATDTHANQPEVVNHTPAPWESLDGMVTPADLADLAVRAAHVSVRSQLCGLSLSPVLPDALPPRQMEVAVGQRPAAPAGDRRRGGRKGGGARGRAGAEGVALQSALSQEEPIC
jgi:hypothetical protein